MSAATKVVVRPQYSNKLKTKKLPQTIFLYQLILVLAVFFYKYIVQGVPLTKRKIMPIITLFSSFNVSIN